MRPTCCAGVRGMRRAGGACVTVSAQSGSRAAPLQSEATMSDRRCLVLCLKPGPTEPHPALSRPSYRRADTADLQAKADHQGVKGRYLTRERSLVRTQPRPSTGSSTRGCYSTARFAAASSREGLRFAGGCALWPRPAPIARSRGRRIPRRRCAPCGAVPAAL